MEKVENVEIGDEEETEDAILMVGLREAIQRIPNAEAGTAVLDKVPSQRKEDSEFGENPRKNAHE